MYVCDSVSLICAYYDVYLNLMFTIIGYHYAYIWPISLPMIKMLQHLVKNDTITLVTVEEGADI